MQKLVDKLSVLGLCLLTLFLGEAGWVSVVALLLAVGIASLNSYFENRVPPVLCVAYVLLSFFVPECRVFLPLIVYDCVGQPSWVLRLGWIAPLPLVFLRSGPSVAVAVVVACAMAALLQIRTASLHRVRADYFDLMDDTKERAMRLERRNRELLDKQDYEVRLATLAERNRIAREIHDNVGHLLTRSILQVSAMGVIRTGDAGLTGELSAVKDTLSDAMDSIRRSVHDLRDESADLKLQLDVMIDRFRPCPVKLRYEAEEIPGDIQFCFAAIVREALNNIARHSDATEAAVTVAEHPAFFQLVISDNGKAKSSGSQSGGIGLQNMRERVEALGGVFRAERQKGFRIFVSVPKGGIL